MLVYAGPTASYSVSNATKDLELSASKIMASSTEAFCYLTRVQGDFDGAGERVRIRRDGETNRWHLDVRGACEDKDVGFLIFNDFGCHQSDIKKVTATARCYAYDQG